MTQTKEIREAHTFTTESSGKAGPVSVILRYNCKRHDDMWRSHASSPVVVVQQLTMIYGDEAVSVSMVGNRDKKWPDLEQEYRELLRGFLVQSDVFRNVPTRRALKTLIRNTKKRIRRMQRRITELQGSDISDEAMLISARWR